MSREYTRKLLDMISDQVLDKDVVITACLKYMSEYDVEDMMHINGMLDEEEEMLDEEEEEG